MDRSPGQLPQENHEVSLLTPAQQLGKAQLPENHCTCVSVKPHKGLPLDFAVLLHFHKNSKTLVLTYFTSFMYLVLFLLKQGLMKPSTLINFKNFMRMCVNICMQGLEVAEDGIKSHGT